MITEIIYDYPPLFSEIRKVFPQANNDGVVFSWGNKVYAPTHSKEQKISKPILAHETVHGVRQTLQTRHILKSKGVEDSVWQEMDCEWEVVEWWKRYMRDVKFRFDEELFAHQQEYRCAVEAAVNRRERQYILKDISHKLASPLYGRMVSPNKAKQLLKAA